MAKDLNTSNLSIVAEDGALKVVSLNDAAEASLGAVHLDGERLEGVYAELRSGELGAMSHGADVIKVPAGAKERDAFLKRWSDAAKKANAAKKAGTMMLLLPLAACGGGGGEAVTTPTVETADIGATNATVDITGAVVGAVVTILSTAVGADTYADVVLNAD
ncbi:MAG: hypothetical protein K9G71_18970 [Rhodobacteraceae bacterium]|nr:hypothetical protein [Paracoccaceae bacterium]MCF8516396.1 hypothetical protein [Paracoccaceae bacterium]MCF8520746.1 hypothetical protein [Paracoccaceae bacterium]